MNVTVNYLGQLEQFAGRPSEKRVCRDGLGLAGLLGDLVGQHGADFGRIVLNDAGRPRASLLMVINGQAVRDAADVTLKDGDELTLLPPIAGG